MCIRDLEIEPFLTSSDCVFVSNKGTHLLRYDSGYSWFNQNYEFLDLVQVLDAHRCKFLPPLQQANIYSQSSALKVCYSYLPILFFYLTDTQINRVPTETDTASWSSWKSNWSYEATNVISSRWIHSSISRVSSTGEQKINLHFAPALFPTSLLTQQTINDPCQVAFSLVGCTTFR